MTLPKIYKSYERVNDNIDNREGSIVKKGEILGIELVAIWLKLDNKIPIHRRLRMLLRLHFQ